MEKKNELGRKGNGEELMYGLRYSEKINNREVGDREEEV